jgi:hypothetical protein
LSVVYFTDRDLGLSFPETLRAANFDVRLHRDHFAPTTPDDEWLAAVSARQWVVITHDARIRYKPNELAAIVKHRARVLVVVGKAPLPVLAVSFVQTHRRIAAFLTAHGAPVIGKVYRAAPDELARNPRAAGRIEVWYPKAGRPGKERTPPRTPVDPR